MRISEEEEEEGEKGRKKIREYKFPSFFFKFSFYFSLFLFLCFYSVFVVEVTETGTRRILKDLKHLEIFGNPSEKFHNFFPHHLLLFLKSDFPPLLGSCEITF